VEQINESKLKDYLSSVFNGAITEVKINKLGSGCVGTGYAVNFKINGKPHIKILKTLFTSNLGMDHFSDRAGSLLLAHSHYHKIPRHVNSLDVGGISENGSIISLGKAKEFFLLMDEAQGKDLFKDFALLAAKENLSEPDRKKILELSHFLAGLHQEKAAENKDSLYKRTLRSAVGGNTSIMSIIDLYPKDLNWVSEEELQKIIQEAVNFWTKHRFSSERLCHVHGDFHPGNIWYKEDGTFALLDRSGQTYGEAADDLTAFSINFIFYSVKERGLLAGAAKEGLELFWNNYLEKTKDQEILCLAPLFFALRSMVVINPAFYPDTFFGSKENADNTRKKMFNFAYNLLKKGRLELDSLADHFQ